MKFGTKAIHAGVEPDPTTGAIMTPIYQTSTYVQAAPGNHKGYEYSRTQNPTRKALEDSLAALENAKHGLAFASGLAAEDAIIKMLEPGDEVIASSDLYGGSYRLFVHIFTKYGLKFHFVDMRKTENVRAKINDKTAMIWVETPTNPMLNVVDIEAMVKLAKEHDLMTCVDNTFASPYLQNPMDMGADLVVHSATKFIGGHSDVVAGLIATNSDDLNERLRFIQNSCGAILGPQDSFLLLRGIKTLHLRIRQHCENARTIAHFLNDHPKVDRVYWPGLESHENHDIAKRQMRDFGGMVSFTLKGDKLDDALKLLSATHLFSLAESLGGVESLIGHPATMTHAAIPVGERIKTGVTDSLIRLSVGVEDAEDLVNDLKEALSSL